MFRSPTELNFECAGYVVKKQSSGFKTYTKVYIGDRDESSPQKMCVVGTTKYGKSNLSVTMFGFTIAEAKKMLSSDLPKNVDLSPYCVDSLEVFALANIHGQEEFDDIVEQLRVTHLTFSGLKFNNILDIASVEGRREHQGYTKAKYFEIGCHEVFFDQLKMNGTIKAYFFDKSRKTDQNDLVKIEITATAPAKKGPYCFNNFSRFVGTVAGYVAAEMRYMNLYPVPKPQNYSGVELANPNEALVQSNLRLRIDRKRRSLLKAIQDNERKRLEYTQ